MTGWSHGKSKHIPAGAARERAVRTVADHRDEYDSQWEAMRPIGQMPGIRTTGTVREWIRQYEADYGTRPGVSTVAHRDLGGWEGERQPIQAEYYAV